MAKATWTAAERTAITKHLQMLRDRFNVSSKTKFTSGRRIYHKCQYDRKAKMSSKHRWVFGARLGHYRMRTGFIEYETVLSSMAMLGHNIPKDRQARGSEALYWIVSHEFAHLLQMIGSNGSAAPKQHGPEFIAAYDLVASEVPWHAVKHLYSAVDGERDEQPAMPPKRPQGRPQASTTVTMHATDDGSTVEHKFEVNGEVWLRTKDADGRYRIVKETK